MMTASACGARSSNGSRSRSTASRRRVDRAAARNQGGCQRLRRARKMQMNIARQHVFEDKSLLDRLGPCKPANLIAVRPRIMWCIGFPSGIDQPRRAPARHTLAWRLHSRAIRETPPPPKLLVRLIIYCGACAQSPNHLLLDLSKQHGLEF
jgi:hypothetical protein